MIRCCIIFLISSIGITIQLEKDNFLNEVLAIIQDRIEILFPQLKDVDMDNVYISELENLIDGFLEVNFSMMKKVFMKVTTMI